MRLLKRCTKSMSIFIMYHPMLDSVQYTIEMFLAEIFLDPLAVACRKQKGERRGLKANVLQIIKSNTWVLCITICWLEPSQFRKQWKSSKQLMRITAKRHLGNVAFCIRSTFARAAPCNSQSALTLSLQYSTSRGPGRSFCILKS